MVVLTLKAHRNSFVVSAAMSAAEAALQTNSTGCKPYAVILRRQCAQTAFRKFAETGLVDPTHFLKTCASDITGCKPYAVRLRRE